MKILSLNFCLLPPLLTNANSKNDLKFERTIEFFNLFSKEYDILLLQEVWDTTWCYFSNIQNFIINLSKSYGFAYHYKLNRKWYQICNDGLLILSKYSIQEVDYLTFHNSGGLQWFVPNGVLFAKIENINFFTTHIHAGTLDSSLCNNIEKSKTIQELQIKELKTFIDLKCKENDKYIIAGDFNSDALFNLKTSYTMISYYKLCDIINSTSLLSKIDYKNTYPIPLEGSILINKKFINNESCVDHVFSNIDIEKIDISLNELKLDKYNLFTSDHAGIEIKLK
jgi:endonuclease/exonuclease/phosphatase family metal-dependent hydrolase